MTVRIVSADAFERNATKDYVYRKYIKKRNVIAELAV
jgi:hypothetical protein